MKKSYKQKKANPVQSSSAGANSIVHRTSDFNYDKWLPWITAIFGILLYINTINHQYVLDDDTVIAKNDIVTKGIRAIPEIMTTAYRKGAWDRQESLYRPLSLVVFAAEWQLAPNHPFLGHLVNILLYALTGFLLYKLLRKWIPLKHPFIVFSIVLLFMAHPLHTEVIANIKSLDEILGLLFGLSSMYFFHEYATKDQPKYLIAGALFFFLSLLSKESALTLLAVIPLSLYFFSSVEEKKKYAYIFAALFISVAIYFVMRKIALGSLVNFSKIELLNNSLAATGNAAERFATAIVFIGYYIRLFFFPHPLSFDYSYNTIPIASFPDHRFLLSMSGIIALTFYAVKNIKKKDPAAFGILFFGITLSIVSNIFILIEATIAERFMFLPSLGLCILSILLLEKGVKFSAKNNPAIPILINRNKIFFVLFLFILTAFSVKTITRNRDWKDNFTLFSIDKDHNPDSYRTLAAYGLELYGKKIFPLKDGDPEKTEYCKEDIEYLNNSLSITPDNFKAWNLLAYCYSQLKDYPRVQNAFENGLKYHKDEPDWIKLHIIGINAYYYTGQYDKAIEISRGALKIEPGNAILWSCLGMNLTEVNDRKNAIDALTKSLQLDSTQADTWYNMGNWYAKGGDFETALKYYYKTLEKDAKHLKVLNNMGNCYAILKQYDKALEFYEKILIREPGNKDAIRNIATTYKNKGNIPKSLEYEKRLQSVEIVPR